MDNDHTVSKKMTEKIKSWLQSNQTLVVFVVLQSVALVIWASRIDARVDIIERLGSPALLALQTKVTSIEATQQHVLHTLNANTSKMDGLSEMLQRHMDNSRK